MTDTSCSSVNMLTHVTKCYLTHMERMGHIYFTSHDSRTHPPSSGRGQSHSNNCERMVPTFAVSVWASEDCALLNDTIGLEEAVDVLLGLLFVQHPNKQLPVFCNTHTDIHK